MEPNEANQHQRPLTCWSFVHSMDAINAFVDLLIRSCTSSLWSLIVDRSLIARWRYFLSHTFHKKRGKRKRKEKETWRWKKRHEKAFSIQNMTRWQAKRSARAAKITDRAEIELRSSIKTQSVQICSVLFSSCWVSDWVWVWVWFCLIRFSWPMNR